ncbi:MAG: phosphoglycerate mutase (2,3-diphosphoglycerate-independent), partial [Candidatus Woykebacteria bacterium RBG_13_40_7b]
DQKTLVIIIIDGWGIATAGTGNAIESANIPNFRELWHSYPRGQLQAAGEAVGLPKNEAGNSEVGHLNIGAGRVVYQDLLRISLSIADGSFLRNESLAHATNHVKRNNSSLHLAGLVGGGVVHSYLEHLYALLWLAKDHNIENVYLHLFTDGRDSPPTSAINYVGEIQEKLSNLSVGEIASISGRYYAMDRDNRWERTKKAYLALVGKEGNKASSVLDSIQNSYSQNITDEFIVPTMIVNAKGQNVGSIKRGDALVFFNFRADRARQLTKAFILPEFNEFPREKIQDLFVVTFSEYEKGLPCAVAFTSKEVDLPLGLVIAERGFRQLRIAETEKYAHVTYFLNGGREDPFIGEDRVLIPSPKVATYDLKPEMSARGITDVAIERINQQFYEMVILNFANPDMVGHSGNLEATKKAVETVDECLGKIVKTTLAMNGKVVVTADHGNAEEMLTLQGEIDTEHSTNHVPIIIVDQDLKMVNNKNLPSGILADIAPTILAILNIPKPQIMTGKNLLASIGK